MPDKLMNNSNDNTQNDPLCKFQSVFGNLNDKLKFNKVLKVVELTKNVNNVIIKLV